MFAGAAAETTRTANISETRTWLLPFPVDVRLTLSAHGRGLGDPTFQVDDAGAVWRTSLTPEGPATIRVLPTTPDCRVTIDSNAATAGVVEIGNSLTADNHLAVGNSVTGSLVTGISLPGSIVTARAWGPGAGWLLGTLPAQLGAYDNISGFDPAAHPVLRDLARRHPGLRVGRTGRLMEALVPAILEQKIVSLEAHRAWKILLSKYGTVPPGPAPRGMSVFPPPRTWRSIPSWEWHRAGVEGVRAQTIIKAATVASSLERLLAGILDCAAPGIGGEPGIRAEPGDESKPGTGGEPGPGSAAGHGSGTGADATRCGAQPGTRARAETVTARSAEVARKLQIIPGIGPWTAAEAMQRAAGDPDAVSVGDYNLPKAVGWALARREKTDDAQMLELLEPYRGHRYRVTRLLTLSSRRAPRRGPRMPVRDYRAI